MKIDVDVLIPEELRDLGKKRKDKLLEACQSERNDAALNTCIIGLKVMNHVYGIGIERADRVSKVWSQKIVDFYTSDREIAFKPEMHMDCIGTLRHDVKKDFGDLSPRRQRQIESFLVENRLDSSDACWYLGTEAMREILGFGNDRIARLNAQWKRDLMDFYEDRETNEPRLKAWLEEIGFAFQGTGFYTYRDDTGKAVKASIAKREIAKEEKNAEKKI